MKTNITIISNANNCQQNQSKKGASVFLFINNEDVATSCLTSIFRKIMPIPETNTAWHILVIGFKVSNLNSQHWE